VDNVKVSVIFPVYNAQDYVEKALNSVVNQTLQEIEIIIIYSTSNDKTEAIIKEFLKTHSKIKYIHNEVLKPISFVRNQGLQNAVGEYIAFIDADDYIDINYLEELYKKAKSANSDIVLASRINEINSKLKDYKIWEFKEDILRISDENRERMLHSVYRSKLVVWGRIIRREFIVENNISFFDGLFGGEDLAFSLLSFLYIKNLSYVKDVHYHHTLGREQSLSNNLELMVGNTIRGLQELRKTMIKRGFKQNLITSAVDTPIADILIGYFNKWNTGLFSRLKLSSAKKLYPFIKKDIIDSLCFEELSNRNKSVVFKLKYKVFTFSLKHNLYFASKLMRIVRNLVKIVCPS
jgi:glycosyltransferase involved in cell wall biosynthesis